MCRLHTHSSGFIKNGFIICEPIFKSVFYRFLTINGFMDYNMLNSLNDLNFGISLTYVLFILSDTLVCMKMGLGSLILSRPP